jgi:hypothetical protein
MSHQHIVMNGGESPLASKIKKSDATKPELYAQSSSISSVNDGGAAPGFSDSPAVHDKKSSTTEAPTLAKGSGVMRSRGKK